VIIASYNDKIFYYKHITKSYPSNKSYTIYNGDVSIFIGQPQEVTVANEMLMYSRLYKYITKWRGDVTLLYVDAVYSIYKSIRILCIYIG